MFPESTLVEGPIPLYYQLQEKIKDLIDTGILQEGDRLPSEREMAGYFQINRRTVSNAIDNLVADGLLLKKRGTGIFVAPKKIISKVNWLRSFHDEASMGGKKAQFKIIKIEIITPPASVCQYLNIQGPEKKVYNLQRLGYLNQEPVLIQKSFIPEWLVPGLDEKLTDNVSLFHLFEEDYGLKLTSGKESLEATTLRQYEADLLEVPQGKAGFVLRRITFSHTTPVEYVKSVLRGDKYIFKTDSQRR
jgi:GntR family transcriptional regulator